MFQSNLFIIDEEKNQSTNRLCRSHKTHISLSLTALSSTWAARVIAGDMCKCWPALQQRKKKKIFVVVILIHDHHNTVPITRSETAVLIFFLRK